MCWAAHCFKQKYVPAGGISSVSFSATGEHCLTAGLDGAVLLHAVQDAGRAQVSQLSVPSSALGDVQDMDAMDDESEATEVKSCQSCCALLQFFFLEDALTVIW